MEELLGLTTPAPLSLTTLAFNQIVSVILASALAWAYTRFGTSMSNRARFAQILPMMAMITVLVISVVKSSLALSLGLVGALSIVRFRTAIKEPEELLYLFMSMAIGVGLGADQRAPTALATVAVLAFVLARTLLTPRHPASNLYLNVTAETRESTAAQIRDILLKYTQAADLRRLDANTTNLQATYLISCANDETLYALMADMQAQLPSCECSFVEQGNTLGA